MHRYFKSSFLLSLIILLACSSLALAQGSKAPIIDGTKAPVSEFPYVAEISLGDSVCSGTLVGEKFVLTAAHCFFDERNRQITNISQFGAVLNGTFYPAAKITIHPSYVSRSSACIERETDAAVMELASAPPINIPRIALQRNPPQVGSTLLLVGFGTQGTGSRGEDGTFPDAGFVNFGTTVIESVDSSYVNWTFDRNKGEANTAGGDSGGPAFLDENGVRYLNSTTCGGTGNAGFDSTSSNTRVDLLASWVDSIAGTTPTNTAPAYIKLPAQTAGRNKQFSYVLQATGTGPITFTLLNELPDGLTLVGATIFGVPTTSGKYSARINASNEFGNVDGWLPITVTESDPITALSIDSARINFSDDADDLLSIKGKISLGNSFAPNRARVLLTIAQLKESFRLDKNGSARKPRGYDFLALTGKLRRGRFTSSRVGISMGLGDSEDLYDKLDTLFPEEAENGAEAPLPVEVVINGATYSRTIIMRYNASRDLWLNVKN